MQRFLTRKFSTRINPFAKHVKTLSKSEGHEQYYSLPSLQDSRYEELPYSIRVLLESAVRNCDNFSVKEKRYRKHFELGENISTSS